MKKLYLHGKHKHLFTLVDDEDFDWLSQWKCSYLKAGRGYVVIYLPDKKVTINMHSLIMQTPKGMVIDHIDGNGLNNQRSNLRICTHQQNLFNRGRIIKGSSKYKGVYWNKKCRKWSSRIKLNNKVYYTGLCNSEIQAAKAYDEKAKQLHGEFAKLNFKK